MHAIPQITKFHAGHVKRAVAALLGLREVSAHNDGSTLWVLAGYGQTGEQNAAKIIAHSSMPAVAKRSERVGSVADHERWEATGEDFQTFIVFTKPNA